MIEEAGADRVGIKISPEMNFNDVSDATPQETFLYLVGKLNALNLASYVDAYWITFIAAVAAMILLAFVH